MTAEMPEEAITKGLGEVLAGLQIFLVGGAVRDRLLERADADRDWVVLGSTVDEMQARGFQQVGRDFPVFLHPKSHEQYALAQGVGGVASVSTTLEEDLERRDLTINAMAMGADGVLVDPFGGRADLEAGILRHVSVQSFAEDPLRVLRVARFVARYDFSVAPETEVLMARVSVKDEFSELPAERLWSEIERALGEKKPRRFIDTLRACGALARVLPEVDAMFGVPQTPRYHPEVDTGEHVMLALEMGVRLQADRLTRFAILVHDLGKGTTPRAIWPHHYGHEGRSVSLVQALCQRLRVPRAYRDLGVLTARYHTHCHRLSQLRAKTILKLLEAMRVVHGDEQLQRFLLACEADSRGREGHAEGNYPQAQRLAAVGKAVSAIRAQDCTPQGNGKMAIAKGLRSARMAAISAMMAKFREAK